MSINFKNIHATIKNSIQGDGFTYIPLKDWIDRERNIIPTSWAGKGFTIKLWITPDTEIENHKCAYMSMQVEFAHSLINDNYLDDLGAMVTAMDNMYNALTDAGYSMQGVSENYFSFYNDPILADTVQSMICVFDQLQFEITIS